MAKLESMQLQFKDFQMGTGSNMRVDGHYFVSNFCGWRTGTSLLDVLASLKRNSGAKKGQTVSCSVYYVGLPESAEYQIDNYRPIVADGESIFVGNFTI